MLVLSRKIGERILIEPGIEIAVIDVRGGKVRIGIEAPASVRIRRDDLAAPLRQNVMKSVAAVSIVS
jgi:carbon storage regulator